MPRPTVSLVSRYAVLAEFGGFYIDLDIQCRRPLNFLRRYPLVMPATRPVGFSNDFLAAAPRHPLMLQVSACVWMAILWLGNLQDTVHAHHTIMQKLALLKGCLLWELHLRVCTAALCRGWSDLLFCEVHSFQHASGHVTAVQGVL